MLYRNSGTSCEFLLVHPGGPFWKNKDAGAWSVPKGEFSPDEDALSAALREFHEETGIAIDGDFLELSPVKMKSGKKVFAFAQERTLDVSTITSNEFEMEWPPRSGKKIMVPEIDRACWFPLNDALEKINEAQRGFLLQVEHFLNS